MTFAAWDICLISSCSLRNTRIKLPSNWSVSCGKKNYVSYCCLGEQIITGDTLQISVNEAPLHHCTTASMSSTLKDEMYSSSSITSFDSFETFAILRAISCITLNGAANSSFSLVVCSL